MTDPSRPASHEPGNGRARPALGATLLLALSLVGCSGSSGATEGAATSVTPTQVPPGAASQAASPSAAVATQGPAASGSPPLAATSGTGGQRGAAVELSGAATKSYTTDDVAATKAADHVIIALFEPGSSTCSLSIELPVDSPPGTYQLGNEVADEAADSDASALYVTLSSCNPSAAEGDYVSHDGTLTITESGKVWSGTFDINTARRLDPSKPLRVKGSFTGLTMR